VSQNARRHGLTTPPPWDQVSKWYRIILSDPQAQLEPTSQEPRLQAALRLAEGEAQVERTINAERDHFFDMVERIRQDDENVPLLDRVMGKSFDIDDHDTLRVIAQNTEDPYLAGAARILARLSPTRPAAMRNTMKVLTRYRREAESARRRAFEAWLAVG
jgi:hypothetical protein